MIRAFLRNERGATAIEYGLIASLIAVAIITAVTTPAISSAYRPYSSAPSRRV